MQWSGASQPEEVGDSGPDLPDPNAAVTVLASCQLVAAWCCPAAALNYASPQRRRCRPLSKPPVPIPSELASLMPTMVNPHDHSDAAPEGPVPKAVVSRLSLYLRELQHLVRDGNETINSTQLGSRLGLTDAQIRKDLAYFGQFGYPGIGYRCDELISAIRGILGTDRDWAVGIVGAGNLGSVLIRHRGFAKQGFRIVAAFDTAAAKIGESIDGVPILPVDQLAATVQREQIKLGILAVPAAEAQPVAEQLVAAGVAGILNFAPVTISVPAAVSTASVDLAIELEQLSFDVVNRSEKN